MKKLVIQNPKTGHTETVTGEEWQLIQEKMPHTFKVISEEVAEEKPTVPEPKTATATATATAKK